LKVIAGYLGLFILPSGQNIDHDVNAITAPMGAEAVVYILVWLCVVLGGIYLLAWYQGRHRARLRLIAFGILWFLVILMPTSSIIPLRDLMFEHRVYLPLVGIGIAFVTFVDLLLNGLFHATRARSAIITVACVAAALALAVATQRRNTAWQTKLALWRDASIKSPHKSRPHNNLGNCYFLLGNYPAAEASYRTAIRLDSHNVEAYYNLALALKNLGRNDEAFLVYRMFVGLASPDSKDSKSSSGGK
jgi:tetratricopeptide (TPR) repeat protein